MMDNAGLNPDQRNKLRKVLLCSYVLTQEIAESRRRTPKGKVAALHRIISGQIVKKYRCLKTIAQKTGMSRHGLGKVNSKDQKLKASTRFTKVRKETDNVINFMKREDNSRTLPGKNDATRLKKGVKIQSHVLTDYLKNLFLKYKAENPQSTISFASFCRCRPEYILKNRFVSRLSCLCTKHQNAGLTLKALRKAGIEVAINLEVAVEKLPSSETLRALVDDSFTVGQWKRVEVKERGKKKFVTRIVETEMDKETFKAHFETQMSDFKSHLYRMKRQYEEMRTLKLNLPNHHLIVQLDFAENYMCRSVEEVQSAYFNMSAVTLHPWVAYYKMDNGELGHQSYVTISDEMSHKASTVMAFMDNIVPELLKLDSSATTIHYWSDSPSSQYRNKYMFNLIEMHKEQYGVAATWNYWESGHGKGPCDGVGGTCKRLADEAVRSGKFVIQDASSFHEWTKTNPMKNVKFRYVCSDMCQEKEKELSEKSVGLRPIKGTMKIHAIRKYKDSLVTRETSCYCEMCLEGRICESWKTATTFSTKQQESSKRGGAKRLAESSETTSNSQSNDPVDIPTNVYITGDFVAAMYDGKCFIGKIVDEDKGEYEIDFMETRKTLFQWPRQRDILWVQKSDVLFKVEEPTPTGKSKRMYKFSDETMSKLACLEANN